MLTLSSGNKYYTQEEYNEILHQNATLRDDIDIIKNALRDEADERDWCSDYNVFIDEINSQLQAVQLNPLEREYEVEVVLTRKQTVTTYIRIDARTELEAISIVEDMPYTDVENNVAEHEWDTEDEDVDILEARIS